MVTTRRSGNGRNRVSHSLVLFHRKPDQGHQKHETASGKRLPKKSGWTKCGRAAWSKPSWRKHQVARDSHVKTIQPHVLTWQALTYQQDLEFLAIETQKPHCLHSGQMLQFRSWFEVGWKETEGMTLVSKIHQFHRGVRRCTFAPLTMSNIQRIGVLTSGGDAPGMNAAIRSVVPLCCVPRH